MTPDKDRVEVVQVFEKYLQSLNGADVALASQVWLQSPDVLVVTPFGRFRGWDSVKNDIYIDSMQKQMREPHVEASNVCLVVAGDVAWLVYDFVFTATWNDGRALMAKDWESHGYQRTADGWRIAHLHYSVPGPPQ
jgi:ketosteroid isomerase-like protein